MHRNATLLKTTVSASKAALFHQTITLNKVLPNEHSQSSYQTANNSIASSRSNLEECEFDDNIQPSTTTIPPQYNEGLFCRRKGVTLPKRSACSVFFILSFELFFDFTYLSFLHY